MRSFILLLIFSTFLVINSNAQSNLSIGQWRSHLPYVNGLWVTQSESTVYYATDWAVLQLDKTEMSTDFLTTVEGLSNTGVRLIQYNDLSDVLIVVYNNSVIDLVKEKAIVTLNQVRNFQGIVGEKIIYNVSVQNDSIVYVSGNYGVSKLNIKSDRFTFTTFTDVIRAAQRFFKAIYISLPTKVFIVPPKIIQKLQILRLGSS